MSNQQKESELLKEIEALKAENKLLKASLDALPNGIAVQDEDRRLIFANSKYKSIEEQLSDPKIQVEGKEETDLMEETFAGRLVESQFSLRKLGEKGEGSDVVRDYREQTIPVTNEEGEVKALLKTVEDISMKVKTERILRSSEVEHRTLVDNAPTIIYRFSTLHGATFWSQRVKKVLGYSVREMYRNPFIWNQSIHPDDRETVNRAIEKAEPGITYMTEYRIKAQNGDWKWLADYFLVESHSSEEKVFLGYAVDISPRKQLEEQLSYTKNRMDLAVRSSGIGVWDWDLRSNAIYFSPTWKSMVGYDPEEIKDSYDAWAQLVHPEDIDGAVKSINEYIDGKLERFEIEFRMQHKDGHWVEILSKGSVMRDSRGKPYRFIGSHQDMSERNRTQKEVSDSEIRWKYALEGNDDGVWDWNLKTNELYFSQRWKEMLGYADHEIPSALEEWEKRVHPDDLEAAYQGIKDHVAGKTENYVNIHRLKHKEGHYIWNLDRGKVIEFDENGEPLRMIGTHTDISDQVKAQEELEESRQKFKAIYDLIHVGITITDEVGNIIDCNKESEILLGISREEHMTRNYAGKEWKIIDVNGEILPSDQYAAVVALNENKVVVNQEMGVYRGDDLVWLSVSAKPLNLKGYGVLVAYVDITELKENAEQLKSSNNAKDRFFSIIAHDLRGPFNTLLNLSQLGLDDLSEQRFDMLEEIMTLIRDASKEAYDLLNNLLNWSRLQVGSISYHETNLDLSSLLNGVTNGLIPTAKNKGVKVKNHIKKDYQIRGDKDMLETVFRNLLSNAIKFTHKGGEVSLGVRKKSDSLECYVKDTGLGIPKPQLKDLLNLQEKDSTIGTNNEKGTGLGLVLVNDFVKRHQGELKIKSEKGKGSTFTVKLPLNS